MSINFADVNFEHFCFGFRCIKVVNEIISSDFFETLLAYLRFGEVVAAADLDETPIKIIVPEAQSDNLLVEVVFGRSFEIFRKFLLLFPD